MADEKSECRKCGRRPPIDGNGIHWNKYLDVLDITCRICRYSWMIEPRNKGDNGRQ